MGAKRIVFATFGSLGDLHPYIALGIELKRRGHKPVIATMDRYRMAVEAEGIEFALMRPLESQLGDTVDLVERIFDVRRGTEYLVKDLVMRHVRATYEDLSCAADGADLLVTHPLAMTGALLAEKKGIPWASSVLAPMNLMSCVDPPLFAPAPWLRAVRKLGIAPYRWLFTLAKLNCRGWERPLAELRAELGMPPARYQALFKGQYSSALNLALFSREIAQPAADWPANTVVCGFARYDGTPIDAATRAQLETFLAAGEAPVVFALGSSAVMIAGDFWNCAIEAVRRLRRRAILLTGPGLPSPFVQGKELGERAQIISFPYIPYSTVFPHALAIVHQAGIGTLSQALAAGRPQLIVPVSFDQPDNADRAVRLGVARTLPFRKANADRLAAELRALLGDSRYGERAGEVAGHIAAENGAACAADRILELVDSYR